MSTNANASQVGQDATSSTPAPLQEEVKKQVVVLDRVLRKTEKLDPSQLSAGDCIKAREELVEHSVRLVYYL
jgi:hypothetical protein